MKNLQCLLKEESVVKATVFFISGKKEIHRERETCVR